ncbi:MAG: hypothetical protein ABI999_15155 [Acidobacteriota bacterium]
MYNRKMFIGHFAVAFGLKRVAPRTNLGWLVAAVAFLDLLWPIFVLLGLERVEIEPGNTAFTPLNFVSYPYSHSLLMAAVWAVVFGGIYFAVSRYKIGAIAVAVGVISHWFLDWVVHRPDLPLYPGGVGVYGLRLWDSVPGTLVLEGLMFAVGLWIYLLSTRARDQQGSVVLWVFVAVLLASYAASSFGPPPPNVSAVAAFAPFAWLFVGLTAWADKHRDVIE